MKAMKQVGAIAATACMAGLLCGGASAGELLRPAASGTSVRAYTGLYTGNTNAADGINAKYESLYSFWYDYRGTIEFPLSNFPAVVQSATLRLVVQGSSGAGSCVYRLYAYNADGNGQVNGADYTCIGTSPISVLYSNATPAVDSTNETDVTAAFNAAISAGWSYFGVHTVQHPEYSAASLMFYNSASGTNVEPVLIVERGTSPSDAPAVDITNGNATVSYDVMTYGIGGTNNAHVVGTMRWTNSLGGGGGTLAAASPWSIGGIALAVGANAITVTGTNAAGLATNDTVTITRGDIGTGAPAVDITNGNAAVTYDVTACGIGGTNNAHVVGTMRWTNGLGGGSGTLAAASPWSIGGIALAVGANGITVTGTNALGQAANDTVTITRGDAGTGAPFVNITNNPVTVGHDVTIYTLGGTNNSNVVGTMRWTNGLSGGSGTLAAASPWSIGGIALAVGANSIAVTGTNALGQATNDTVTITRGDAGTGVPFVDITNSTPAPLDFSVTDFTLGGTNNGEVVGTMRWTNSLGGSGTLAAAPAWSLSVTGLSVGANVVTVSGSNLWSQTASDAITLVRSSQVQTGSGWTNLAAGLSGSAVALAPGTNGELYAGGSFITTADGVSVWNIAKWDGTTWTALGAGVSASVNALALGTNGDLYVGGIFTTAGGVTANGVAKWNGTTWTNLGSGVGNSVSVSALAAGTNGVLYAGGSFTNAGGIPANRVAKWNGTSWTNLGAGVGGAVIALALGTNGELYAGGSFNTADGAPAAKIAKWDGTSWSAFGSGLGSTVRALALGTNGEVYAGGEFTTAGGAAAAKIAKWDGTSWTNLGSGMNGNVYALALKPSGELYAGGFFTNAGEVSASRVAKWDGTSWTNLGSGMNAQVFALASRMGGELYAGGMFTNAGGVAAKYIAKWQALSEWHILASAGAHGSISPSGSVAVANGGLTLFTVMADTYYAIDQVVTNGSATPGVSGLAACTSVWADVAADGTISATFAALTTGDGTPYWWLALHGLTNGGVSFEQAAAGDTDRDGPPACSEYLAGTDPTNAASVFAIRSIQQRGRELAWSSVSGRVYAILFATNLAAGGFQVLGTASNLPATPDMNYYTNTTVTNAGALFYRLRARPE